MQGKKVRAFVSLFGLALLGAACAVLRPGRLEVRAVEGLRVAEVFGGEARLEVALRLKTGAPVAARVEVLSYRIYLGGQERPAGYGGALPVLEVPAGGEVGLLLPVFVRLSDLPADLPALLLGGALSYRAEVEIFAETSLGRRRFLLTPQGEAPLGEGFRALMEGAFDSREVRLVSVGPLGVKGGVFRIGLRLHFPGHLPFPVKVKATRYTIRLGGAPVGEGSSLQEFSVEPQSGGEGYFFLEVPALQIPEALAQLALGASFLELEGEVEIEPIGPVRQVAFHIRAPLP